MKLSLLIILGITLTTTAVNGSSTFAQTGKKKPATAKTVVAKPAPKAATNGPVVLGTTQLPGDFGKLGTTYTIGKGQPLNFTLKSATYSVAPFCSGISVVIPKADEKLLILHYTVHNPQPREQYFSARSLQFTAVDARDVNHNDAGLVNRDGTRDDATISLKPAQKLDIESVIVVPASGVVPKLIVQKEADAPVIRYDLKEKVAPLDAAYAQASDTSGATALAVVPAKAGTFVPLGAFDGRLESIAYTTETLNQQKPSAGQQYAVATIVLKNQTTRPQALYGHHWNAELTDTDGEKTAYNQTMLKGTRDELVGSQIDPGAEVKVRVFFPLPNSAKAKTLTLSHNTGGRAAAFDVESSK